MSTQPAAEPRAERPTASALELVIEPRTRDLGDGFMVRRVLPFAEHRAVGPFVFFDHMGPTVFPAGKGLDVRPHPHIGLATVTYLFEGEITHRDDLGSVQVIAPGAVNWMTAGRGIVHSERTPAEARATGSRVHGIQLWVGLPKEHEETAPAFVHHPADTLPVIEGEGRRVRVMIGSFLGATSPVAVFSDIFYADADLAKGTRFEVPAEHEERAVYVLSGAITLEEQRFEPGRLLVLRAGTVPTLIAEERSQLLLLGGAPLDGPRHIWWNFVSSSEERIEKAKAQWKSGGFAPVPGETEFIPLPE